MSKNQLISLSGGNVAVGPTNLKLFHLWANLGALAFYLALAPYVHNLGQVQPLDLLQGFAITSVFALPQA